MGICPSVVFGLSLYMFGEKGKEEKIIIYGLVLEINPLQVSHMRNTYLDKNVLRKRKLGTLLIRK